jgi:hypothetical protein
MRPVSGLAILSLNPSLQMKLTDDYAAGNTDAHKSPVDERYRLFTPVCAAPYNPTGSEGTSFRSKKAFRSAQI